MPFRARSSSPPPASAAFAILAGCGPGFTRWPAANATAGCARGKRASVRRPTWPPRPPAAPMRKQVARHAGQCDACAYRRRSALRPAALDGMAPQAALPRGLREKVLRLCADHGPLAQAYREEARQGAGPFAANGFPQQVRPPRRRMVALSGGAAASVLLIV